MKIIVIGGTGHIGKFLTRMLYDAGHALVLVTSGRTPVSEGYVESGIDFIKLQYQEMLTDGTFSSLLREKQPEVVIDILQGDIHRVYSQSLEAGVEQLLVCGSVWMFGRPRVVPTPDTTQTECPFEGYAKRYREMQEVIDQSRTSPLSVSAIMPPNICGPGKIPLDGSGGRSIEVHRAHQKGEPVFLPYPGNNLVGPCDAEDVARGFFCALNHRKAAAGEIFNVGSAYALAAEKFIEAYATIYGSVIPIEYVSTEKYVSEILPDVGANFHFTAHMCPDLSKISSQIEYKPAYTPEETMERAVKWMMDKQLL